MKNIRLKPRISVVFFGSLVALSISGCVTQTLPNPSASIPTTPSVPLPIPTPSGSPSESSEESSSSESSSSSSESSSGSSGESASIPSSSPTGFPDPSSSSSGDGSSNDSSNSSETGEGEAESGSETAGDSSDSDPTLEDPTFDPENEPTFEEPIQTAGEGEGTGAGEAGDSEPTFEEPASSSAGNAESVQAGSGNSSSSGSGTLGDRSLEELEAIFGEQIDTFDGMILREQRNAEQAANSTLSNGTGNETIATAAQAAGIGTFADYSPGSETFENGEVINGVVIDESEIPADIPPAHDDDVVASQIREAAMTEPDPVQREILWQEYRKHKGI